MLRIHTGRCSQSREHNLQRGTVHWRQSQSRSAHDNIGERATARIGGYGQTMCRLAAVDDCSEKSAVVIGIGIGIGTW